MKGTIEHIYGFWNIADCLNGVDYGFRKIFITI